MRDQLVSSSRTSHRVVATVCISAGAVERAAAPRKLRRNAPDAIPLSVIGRLAVSRDRAGQGLGADLLSDPLRRIALASRSIGIGAVSIAGNLLINCRMASAGGSHDRHSRSRSALNS